MLRLILVLVAAAEYGGLAILGWGAHASDGSLCRAVGNDCGGAVLPAAI
jgi:hypothetical protein